jgi:uncharacterized protein (DUF4415 family)
MGIVQVIATENESFTEEMLAELNALKNRTIDYSDIPAHTPEEMEEMRLMAIEMRKKQMFSLRLKTSTIEWWKSLGSGYTTIMARFLDEAKKHPEWVKTCL